MTSYTDYILPLTIAGILLYGLIKRIDVFEAFLAGAGSGLRTAADITPALVCLLTAVAMFRASGGLEVLSWVFAPAVKAIGFPEEVIPLALLRPVSGSGSLAIFSDILARCGPDSYAGRVASVLEGSTETTFYTIAVYYGATRVHDSRHTLPAALLADLAGIIMSCLAVRLTLY